MRNKFCLRPLFGVWFLAAVHSAAAHETDHFTLPHGRAFADVGPFLTEMFYANIADAVRRTNAQISAAAGRNDQAALERLRSDEHIALAVCQEFPTFVTFIEDLERLFHSPGLSRRYPGLLVAHKPSVSVYEQVYLPVDPHRFYIMWRSSIVMIDGVRLGTDKIGHFVHNGWNYYVEYRATLRRGGDREEARRRAIWLGAGDHFFFSERHLLGTLTSGVISNADIAANYLGLLFYLNLTEPVALRGVERPPMLVLEEGHWRLASRVRPDSDFLTLFFSEHMDEALNPNLYEPITIDGMRRLVTDRCAAMRQWYTDENGVPWPHGWFEDKFRELQTYYGVDYGHTGDEPRLLRVADLCFCELDGTTPAQSLYAALHRRDLAALRRLLEQGSININAPFASDLMTLAAEESFTPLHVAAQRHWPEGAAALLAHGADWQTASARGITPLMLAVGDADVVAQLLQAGAAVDAQDDLGRTALHWAVRAGAAETVRRLLAAGAAANAADLDGEAPLHLAARADQAEVAAALLAGGADPDLAGAYQATPLHLAAQAGRSRLAERLIAAGANLNAVDAFGCTPLHDAAGGGSLPLVRLLVQHGADPQTRDLQGLTPIRTAELAGRLELVELMQSSPHVGAVDQPTNAAVR